MDALILVGGEGTRLRPLTYDTPKPMLPIVGFPIVARIVEWLSRFGVRRAVLSLGYRPDAFLRAFPTNAWAGVELRYAVEPTPLDTGGAIRFAAEHGGVGEGPLIIVNGDVLTDLDLAELIKFHGDRGAEATIALTPVDDPSVFGVVPTDDQGRVTAFVEKPPPGEAPTNLINAGTYVFEPSVLARIATGRRVSVERELFPSMVDEGVLYAMASSAYWIDTGSPGRYLQAQFDVLSGARLEVNLPPSIETHPGVHIGQGARCDGELAGAVFVGSQTNIAAGAFVSDSVIESGCTVGAGATVRRSMLLAGARLGENVHCEDSIVGERAHIGARAVLSGFTIVGSSVEVEGDAQLRGARLPAPADPASP